MSLNKYADPNFKKPVQVDWLDKFLKLLGEENLTIVRGNFPTAAMDVENRVIYISDHFVEDPNARILAGAHEVGHAKFTPRDWGHHAIKGKKLSQRYKQALNIVEDIRIERLIRNEYPGLVRNFRDGYRWMIEQGYFGDKEKLKQEDLRFSDIVNMKSKLGEDSQFDFKNNRDAAAYRYIRSAENFEEVAVRARFMMLYEENQEDEDDQDGDGQGEPNQKSQDKISRLIREAQKDPSENPGLFEDDNSGDENKMSETYAQYEKSMEAAAAKGKNGQPMTFDKKFKAKRVDTNKLVSKLFG